MPMPRKAQSTSTSRSRSRSGAPVPVLPDAARTASSATDPFAFEHATDALFTAVDDEVLAEDDASEDEDGREMAMGVSRAGGSLGFAARALKGAGVSVFEKVRREKEALARAAKEVREGFNHRFGSGKTTTTTTTTMSAGVGGEVTRAVVDDVGRRREEDAFDDVEDVEATAAGETKAANELVARVPLVESEDDDDDDDDDDDNANMDDAANARPVRVAEDLFDEVAAASPNARRVEKTAQRIVRKGKSVAAAAKDDENPSTSGAAATISTDVGVPRQLAAQKRPLVEAAARSRERKPPNAKKTKVTLKEFAGEDDSEMITAYDDHMDDVMPRSGAQLADIDEANYAVSGLSSIRDVKEKIRCVNVLVSLLTDQRKRRLLHSHGLHVKIANAAHDAALSANAPKVLKFGSSALLYLASLDLKPPASDVMLSDKAANACRSLLKHSASDKDAVYIKVESTIRNSLRGMKFLPHEAKDAQTLALLVAHHALKQEQDAILASGKGPGAGDSANEFRTRLTRANAITEVCNLVAESTRTLQKFAAVCFAPTDASTSAVDVDADELDEFATKAAQCTARLFRCSRVLESATFESTEACAVVSSTSLHRGKEDDSSSSDGRRRRRLELLALKTGAFMQSPSAKENTSVNAGGAARRGNGSASAPIDIASSPSPVKSRLGGITMTPPSTPGAARLVGDGNDRDEDDERITPLSSPVPIGLLHSQRSRSGAVENSIAWLADNGLRTPVKGSSANAYTATRALVDALPALAAATTASLIGAKKGTDMSGIRVMYDGGLALDHRVATGTCKSVLSVLMNVTNENIEGCEAVCGEDDGGLLIIASLIPWFARSVEGYTLSELKSKQQRSRVPRDDAGSSLLNAALALLVNIIEVDTSMAGKLRSTMVDIDGKAVSFIDVLTLLFLQSGGADDDKDDANDAADEHVTAEMIEKHQRDGDDVILQAYTALLLAFLIEDQPAMRAEVTSRFPPSAGLKPLADTLERFHSFHESLNSISAASSDRLVKVVQWLK